MHVVGSTEVGNTRAAKIGLDWIVVDNVKTEKMGADKLLEA